MGTSANIVTGCLYDPGDPRALATAVKSLWSDPAAAVRMGVVARREFEAKYTAARNYELLMKIQGMASRRARRESRQ